MSKAAVHKETTSPSYEELEAKNKRLESELELCKFQLEQLKEHVFGRKSEKQYPVLALQGELFEEGKSVERIPQEEEDFTDIDAHKRKRRSKKETPENLPVEELVYVPEQTHCSCGTELKEFSRDTRKEVEFEPARFFERHHVTVHCSCPKCKSVYSGETPEKHKPVIAGAEVGAGFLSHVVTSRICDYLPYYRQSQMYEREGVFFPDKTLSRYGLQVAALLEPIAKAIKKLLLEKPYLQADETHLDVLDPEKKRNTHRGQLWVLSDPLSSVTYYEYHKGRTQEASELFLESYSGALQTDAYVVYDKHLGIKLGCMAHARRYFRKAKKLVPKECSHVLRMISELYKIEKELKKIRGELSLEDWFEERRRVRLEKSKPILDTLKKYLLKHKGSWLLEEHPMYKAINYMLVRFNVFTEDIQDRRYEIDNNHVERTIRPVAIGRRNWLFAGSQHGAKMSAVLMTVIQSCKQLGINPQRYLRDVLPRLANHNTTTLTGLTPLDWFPA